MEETGKEREPDDNELKKRVSDSVMEQIYVMRPEHMNAAGRLFGGRLMEWIDEVAGIVGIRHAQNDVVTASVDNLRFIRGAYLGDLVVLTGRVTFVGRTSIEVRVDTYVEDLNGMRHPINRAYVTLVAVDENGNPCKVPGIYLENDAEYAEWVAGKKRREIRIQRTKEGF